MDTTIKCSIHDVVLPKEAKCLLCSFEKLEITPDLLSIKGEFESYMSAQNKCQISKDNEIQELQEQVNYISKTYFEINEENSVLKSEMKIIEGNIDDHFLAIKKYTQREASIRVADNIKNIIRAVFDAYPIDGSFRQTSEKYSEIFKVELKKQIKKKNPIYGSILKVISKVAREAITQTVINATNKTKLRTIQNDQVREIEAKLKNQLVGVIDKIGYESIDIIERKESQKKDLDFEFHHLRKKALESRIKQTGYLTTVGWLLVMFGLMINTYIFLIGHSPPIGNAEYIIQVLPFALALLLITKGLVESRKTIELFDNENKSKSDAYQSKSFLSSLASIKGNMAAAGKVIKRQDEMNV